MYAIEHASYFVEQKYGRSSSQLDFNKYNHILPINRAFGRKNSFYWISYKFSENTKSQKL